MTERIADRKLREAGGVDLSDRLLETNRVDTVAHREHLVNGLVVLGAVRPRRSDAEAIEDRVQRRQTNVEAIERLRVPGELRVDTAAVARGERKREARLVSRPQDEPVLAGRGNGVEPLPVCLTLVCHLDVTGVPDTERVRLPVDHVERCAAVLLVETNVRRALARDTEAVTGRVVATGCVATLRSLRVLVRSGQAAIETLREVDCDVLRLTPEDTPLRQVRRRDLRVPAILGDDRLEVLPGARTRLESHHADKIVDRIHLTVEFEAQRCPYGLTVRRAQLA